MEGVKEKRYEVIATQAQDKREWIFKIWDNRNCNCLQFQGEDALFLDGKVVDKRVKKLNEDVGGLG